MRLSRRTFVAGAAAGVAGGLEALLPFSPATAAETGVTHDLVRFTPEIEPIVRLIEDTPRERCVEVLADRMRGGLSYKQFLAALFLAGIRNVNPQPPGFKFHCVFVIHAANYLSAMAPPEERLLPLFWALNEFKGSQEEDRKTGDFTLREVAGPLPSGQAIWDEFHAAMKDWDEARADRAITALARSEKQETVFEGLWEYGARDYRNIGHKAIFVANAWRTLQTIGWQHAEPTLRSIVLSLLDYGKTKRVNNYAFEDQAYLANVELAAKSIKTLPANWQGGTGDKAATLDLLAPLRAGQIGPACEMAAKQLAAGQHGAQPVWDAVRLAGGELMMRQAGVLALHTITSVNALHFGFRTARDAKTQLLLLLQAVGWLAQFRNTIDTARDVDVRITDIEPGEVPDSRDKSIEAILTAVASDRATAASKALALARRDPKVDDYFENARRLIFLKASDPHQFKWPAAVFEDYTLVSPEWRPEYLAAATYEFCGTGHPDSPVVQHAIAALKGV